MLATPGIEQALQKVLSTGTTLRCRPGTLLGTSRAAATAARVFFKGCEGVGLWLVTEAAVKNLDLPVSYVLAGVGVGLAVVPLCLQSIQRLEIILNSCGESAAERLRSWAHGEGNSYGAVGDDVKKDRRAVDAVCRKIENEETRLSVAVNLLLGNVLMSAKTGLGKAGIGALVGATVGTTGLSLFTTTLGIRSAQDSIREKTRDDRPHDPPTIPMSAGAQGKLRAELHRLRAVRNPFSLSQGEHIDRSLQRVDKMLENYQFIQSVSAVSGLLVVCSAFGIGLALRPTGDSEHDFVVGSYLPALVNFALVTRGLLKGARGLPSTVRSRATLESVIGDKMVLADRLETNQLDQSFNGADHARVVAVNALEETTRRRDAQAAAVTELEEAQRPLDAKVKVLKQELAQVEAEEKAEKEKAEKEKAEKEKAEKEKAEKEKASERSSPARNKN